VYEYFLLRRFRGVAGTWVHIRTQKKYVTKKHYFKSFKITNTLGMFIFLNIKVYIRIKEIFKKFAYRICANFCKKRFRYSLFPHISFNLASLTVTTVLRQVTRRVLRQNCPLNDKLLNPEGQGIMILRGVSHNSQMEKT